MSNEIMKQQNLPSSLTEAIQMGKVFYESGLFSDLKSAAQAVVKIQAGAEIGIAPFASLSGIHIIQGKPTIGAGIIAARIKGSGKYDYRVLQQDEKACSIDFFQGKEKIGNSTFTYADAQKAGTKNLDKYAKNMLFARAISNGVKWFCPDVFTGPVYVPEEMTEDITPLSVTTETTPATNGAKAKPTMTEKAFGQLITKLQACKTTEEVTELQTKVSDYTLSDDQASRFTEVAGGLTLL